MAFSISDITDIFNRPKPQDVPVLQGPTQSVGDLVAGMDATYKVESQNWYSAKPYGFKMTTRDGGTFTMFLPISPQNLNISTPFATNMIPTLYGTIEEHSDVRYFDITIEGTTGMAPKHVAPSFAKDPGAAFKETRKSGRTNVEIASSISAGGFFSKTLGLVNQIKNKAADLLDGGQKPKAGLIPDNSGYVAFHNLYRFLLQYKKDASSTSGTQIRKEHPLTFFNYKDNNQYDVVVKSFT